MLFFISYSIAILIAYYRVLQASFIELAAVTSSWSSIKNRPHTPRTMFFMVIINNCMYNTKRISDTGELCGKSKLIRAFLLARLLIISKIY